MPKFEFELTKIGPSAIMSAITMLFVGGMIWQQNTGAQDQLRKDVDNANVRVDMVNARINTLHAHDASIQVLQRDVLYIRESLSRIERIVKPGN